MLLSFKTLIKLTSRTTVSAAKQISSNIALFLTGHCPMSGAIIQAGIQEIFGKHQAYYTRSKRCALCLNQKLKMALQRNNNTLKKRTEILNQCRHRNKCTLMSYDNKNQSLVSFSSFNKVLPTDLLFSAIWQDSFSQQLSRLLSTHISRESIS